MGTFYNQVTAGEIVLLPGDKVTALGADQNLGPHTVVISGYVDQRVPADDDDDVVRTDDLVFDIKDVAWEHKFLQASTMLSWGEIYGHDSDDVDHSRWGIRKLTTGHADDVVMGKAVKKLRVHAQIVTQGEENYWLRFGYQIVANGTLADVGSVRKALNVTTELFPELAERLQKEIERE